MTVAVTTAHGSSRWSRELAMSRAVRTVESLPRSRWSAPGHQRGEEVGLHDRQRQVGDDDQDPADRLERVAGRLVVDARRGRSGRRYIATTSSDPMADSTGNQARVLSDLRTAHERLAISHEVWNRLIGHQYRSRDGPGVVRRGRPRRYAPRGGPLRRSRSREPHGRPHRLQRRLRPPPGDRPRVQRHRGDAFGSPGDRRLGRRAGSGRGRGRRRRRPTRRRADLGPLRRRVRYGRSSTGAYGWPPPS